MISYSQIPDIHFEIVSQDISNDSITVRPWSTMYANPISTYPTYNISVSLLDLTKDINQQIATFCSNIVRTTIIRESSAYDTLVEFISSNTGVPQFVPAAAVLQYTQYTALSSSTQVDSYSGVNFIV